MREYIVQYERKEADNPKGKCDLCNHAIVGEVVRCKDCVYLNRKEAYGDEWKECTHYPQHHIRLNDYCSYGERKE